MLWRRCRPCAHSAFSRRVVDGPLLTAGAGRAGGGGLRGGLCAAVGAVRPRLNSNIAARCPCEREEEGGDGVTEIPMGFSFWVQRSECESAMAARSIGVLKPKGMHGLDPWSLADGLDPLTGAPRSGRRSMRGRDDADVLTRRRR